MNQIEIIPTKVLEEIKTNISYIRDQLENSSSASQKWLKSAEVRKLLQISPGTLQTLRVKRLIPYTKIGDTFYYPLDGIHQILEDNLVK